LRLVSLASLNPCFQLALLIFIEGFIAYHLFIEGANDKEGGNFRRGQDGKCG
jgi:hypothetical protein